MTDEHDSQLQQVLADLQSRYGQRVIAPARQADFAPLPTGFDLIDTQIEGGFVPGRLTVVLGTPTSGATTLALYWLGRIPETDAPVVYLDAAGQFDPHMAARCGVTPDCLLLIRPPDPAATFAIARDILANGAASALILDVGDKPMSITSEDVRRLRPALRGSSAALVWLGSTLPAALTPLIDVQLRVERLAWRQRGADVIGLHSRILIERDRTGGGGRAVLIELRFADAPRSGSGR